MLPPAARRPTAPAPGRSRPALTLRVAVVAGRCLGHPPGAAFTLCRVVAAAGAGATRTRGPKPHASASRTTETRA